MSVRISLNIEPVGNVAKLVIQQEKKDDKGAYQVSGRNEISSPIAMVSPTFELQEGEKFMVALLPGEKIVFDPEQASTHVEAEQAPEGPPPQGGGGPGEDKHRSTTHTSSHSTASHSKK